jgi:hypothetical protein
MWPFDPAPPRPSTVRCWDGPPPGSPEREAAKCWEATVSQHFVRSVRSVLHCCSSSQSPINVFAFERVAQHARWLFHSRDSNCHQPDLAPAGRCFFRKLSHGPNFNKFLGLAVFMTLVAVCAGRMCSWPKAITGDDEPADLHEGDLVTRYGKYFRWSTKDHLRRSELDKWRLEVGEKVQAKFFTRGGSADTARSFIPYYCGYNRWHRNLPRA